MGCVVTIQGLTGSWYSGRWKNIHGAIGISDMPLFMGGLATHSASCVSLCMSLCGTRHGPCSLAWHPAGRP